MIPKILTLVRGLPGSGKSTFANYLWNEYAICEADKFFTDKDGTRRTEIRTKWWENPLEMTYKSISVEPLENLPELPVNANALDSIDYYLSKDKKVFFGHYWLSEESPKLQNQSAFGSV